MFGSWYGLVGFLLLYMGVLGIVLWWWHRLHTRRPK